MTLPEGFIPKLAKILGEIERLAKALEPAGHTGDDETGCDYDCTHCDHNALMGAIEAALANLEDAQPSPGRAPAPTEGLLPCPFCGSAAVRDTVNGIHCSARCGGVWVGSIKVDPVAAWNRRVPHSATPSSSSPAPTPEGQRCATCRGPILPNDVPPCSFMCGECFRRSWLEKNDEACRADAAPIPERNDCLTGWTWDGSGWQRVSTDTPPLLVFSVGSDSALPNPEERDAARFIVHARPSASPREVAHLTADGRFLVAADATRDELATALEYAARSVAARALPQPTPEGDRA
jgi:hypothetical protein